jgi:Pectate lyase superfamily protein/Right handed beta helix region
MPNKSIPTLGDSNWGTPLNAHLSQLQNPTNGGINTFEQFSGRPTTLTTDDVGKTYLYTQTGNLHQWTGTIWKVLNESVINVKDYGAIGDGVADDTAAIQTAVDLGKSCFFPEAIYSVIGLSVQSNCTYFGVGDNSVISLIEPDRTVNDLNYAFALNFKSNVTIKDLKISSQRYNSIPKPIAYALCGISVYLSKNITISNVNIVSFANYGIFISGTATNDSEDVIVENCYFDNWSTRDTGSSFGAIHFGHGTNRCIARNNRVMCAATFGIIFSDLYVPGESKNHQAIDNVIENSINYGIAVYNESQPLDGHNYIITGNKIKNIQGSFSTLAVKSFGAGIYCVACKNVKITNNYIENTNIFTTQGGTLAEGNIGISTSTGEIVVENNVCKKSGCYGIYLVGCYDGAIINGNSISDSKNETLYLLNCNKIICTNNKITAKSNTVRTPMTIDTVNNSIFSTNNIFYDAVTSQDAVYISNSNFVNFSSNFVEMTSSIGTNRIANCDNLIIANNIYKIPNSTTHTAYFQTKNTNTKIMGNSFINNSTTKLCFDGVTTNTFVDKSNRLSIANITNTSTGLVIDI